MRRGIFDLSVNAGFDCVKHIEIEDYSEIILVAMSENVPITKTCLLKYTENLLPKNEKFQIKKI